MCILQKLKRRNPEEVYTRDLIPLMRGILPTCVEKGLKVIDNGGDRAPAAGGDTASSPASSDPIEQ